jgi:uncharacterized membrane protein YhhN
VLTTCLVIAAIAAVANWWSRITDNRTVELLSKPIATIAIGGVAVAAAEQGDVSTAALVAAIVGFLCCLAGDVALLPAVDRFVVGLASFLVGHIAFVVMFTLLGLDEWWLGIVALVGVSIVAVLLGRPIVLGARTKDASLATPVRAYLAIISSMAVVGWATGRPAAIAGSALFVASDSVLGWSQFVDRRRWMPVTIMVTYHLALLGIALSLL